MATGKIEKVMNDSGSGYCKMPDGTLTCWGTISVPYPTAITNATGKFLLTSIFPLS